MTSPLSDTSTNMFTEPNPPDEKELYKCVHCGFCLQSCPTYLSTGLETESPRGRIALMKAVNEGRIGITPNIIKHWDRCIQCRACEVACPSGVPYGNLIEATMSQVKAKRENSILTRLITHLSMNWILPYQARLKFLVKTLRIYQNLGFQWIVRKSSILNLIPGNMAELEASLPFIPSKMFDANGKTIPAMNEVKSRVSLLSGCVMPLVHGPAMDGVVNVLIRNGCEVSVPGNQVCCGALHSHIGDLDTARTLARRNIDAFSDKDIDAIVVASAGCGSRMKEYAHLLKQDTEYSEKAQRFSALVRDIHEFLIDLPFEPPKLSLNLKVTYQDSCHLANSQHITSQPRDLLKSIPGLDFVELPNSSMCCGGGGTYTLTERTLSLDVLKSKMLNVRETETDILATANPGCLIQLQYGAKINRMPIKIKYVTDVLNEAYGLETMEQSDSNITTSQQ